MATIEDEAYYADESLWGNYQYTTLEEVVNNYMMSITSDDFTSSMNRHQVLYQTRRGLREFYYDVLREVKGIALDLSPSLQVTLPPDYINYVRISWLDKDGLLHPMAVDESIPIAKVYLQDNNYGLLFDINGCVLEGAPIKQFQSVTIDPNSDFGSLTGFVFDTSALGFQPNKNMSNTYVNGKYRIDKANGIIQFGSDTQGKTVVLEYISDGLWDGCEGRPESEQRVNKFAETALYDFVYYELIKRLRNVPANEKMRAKKEYYNSRRVAKMRINTLRKDELLQVFKGSSKWIK